MRNMPLTREEGLVYAQHASHTHGRSLVYAQHASHTHGRRAWSMRNRTLSPMGGEPGLCATGLSHPWEESLVYAQSVPHPWEESLVYAQSVPHP